MVLIFIENPNIRVFHECQQLFKVFEIPGTGESLNLIFFFQNTRGPSGFSIWKIFKYPDMVVLGL